MIDLLMITLAMMVTVAATWPPRGTRRAWLLFGLLILWVVLVVIGWRRGIQPGFAAWLVLLSAIGALVGLVTLWSLSNLLARTRRK